MVDDVCKVAKAEDEYRWQTHAGLFGTPHRSEAVAMLEEGLRAPDCAVTSEYLRTLSRLKLAMAGAPLLGEDQYLRAAAGGAAQGAGEQPTRRAPRGSLPCSTRSASTVMRRPANLETLRASLAKVLGSFRTGVARLLDSQWQLARSPAMATPLLGIVGEARPRGSQLRSISDLA
jgi:hypothetical protein